MKQTIFVAALLALTMPAAALADGAPSPAIHSLVQDGQDVAIELAVPEGPYLERAYDLVRSTVTSDGQDDADIFADRVFELDECVDPCPDVPLFEVIDWCAPPGSHRYFLRQDGTELDSADLSVDDTGDDCLMDPDEEIDADTGASESACATAAPGRTSPSLLVTLICLGIGLAAARRTK